MMTRIPTMLAMAAMMFMTQLAIGQCYIDGNGNQVCRTGPVRKVIQSIAPASRVSQTPTAYSYPTISGTTITYGSTVTPTDRPAAVRSSSPEAVPEQLRPQLHARSGCEPGERTAN